MTYLRAAHQNEIERQRLTFARLAKTHDAFLEFIGKHAGPRERILDLGCGAGCFTRLLAERFVSYVEGWDINESFIAAARETAKQQGIEESRLQYRTAGFFDTASPELTRSFDMVLFRETMMCVSDPVRLLAWTKDLLADDGYVAALEPDYGMTSMYPEISGWNDFFSAYSQYCSGYGENFSFGRTMLDIFQQAGLKEIAVTPFTEIRTARDQAGLRDFMEIEIQSIDQDMKGFVKKTGYSRKKIDEVLTTMKYLHRHPGAYVQTHMVAICGKI